MSNEGVSVIIPTIRTDNNSLENLTSVCNSLDAFKGKKELVLIIDRPVDVEDRILNGLKRYNFVNPIFSTTSNGSALARMKGISKSIYPILMFTDDDCMVPTNWVNNLYTYIATLGIVAGNLQSSNPSSLISKLEEYIDYYRIRAVDSNGKIKFLSFPNFGIKRELLPKKPFELNKLNTVEDFDLSCKLRTENKLINFKKDLTVLVEYPSTLKEVIKRRVKHAKGIAYLHNEYESLLWNQLEIGDVTKITQRWAEISFNSPFNFFEKLLFFGINMSYCAALKYYTAQFSRKVVYGN